MTALHPSGSEGPRTPCRSCGRSGPRHQAGGGGGFLEGLWDGAAKAPLRRGEERTGFCRASHPRPGHGCPLRPWSCRAGWGLGQGQRRGREPPTPSPPQVESSFGHYRQFLMQASAYLRSPHRNLRLAAMKFIGGCSRPRAH